MTKKFLAALVVALLYLSQSPSHPATGVATTSTGGSTLTKTTCSTFAPMKDVAWYKAQQHYNTTIRTYRYDKDGLDSDRDGYACEALTTQTMVPGEPRCYRSGLLMRQQCAGRDLYRAVALLTSRLDAAAIRAAALDVYMPYRANSNVASLLQDAFGAPSTCVRTSMLAFVRERNSAQQVEAAFLDLLGVGQYVIGELPNNPYATVADTYLTVAADTLRITSRVAAIAKAISSAGLAATCF